MERAVLAMLRTSFFGGAVLCAGLALVSCTKVCRNETAQVQIADITLLLERGGDWDAGGGREDDGIDSSGWPCWSPGSPPIAVDILHFDTEAFAGDGRPSAALVSRTRATSPPPWTGVLPGAVERARGPGYLVECRPVEVLPSVCSIIFSLSPTVFGRTRFLEGYFPGEQWGAFVAHVRAEFAARTIDPDGSTFPLAPAE